MIASTEQKRAVFLSAPQMSYPSFLGFNIHFLCPKFYIDYPPLAPQSAIKIAHSVFELGSITL